MRARRVGSLDAGGRWYDSRGGAISRLESAVASKTAFCHQCWRLSARVVAEGREMQKVWLGLAILAAEAVVLVWLVAGHVLQWFTSGLTG